MFWDEGLLIEKSVAVHELAAITAESQPVSSSAVVLGKPTANGDVVLYVSDYVNGQIQRMTTSAGTTTTSGKCGCIQYMHSVHAFGFSRPLLKNWLLTFFGGD